MVATDLFSHAGCCYLVYTDYISGWPVLDRWRPDSTSRDVIRAFARNFVDLGIPVRLRSDGGPQFPSREFDQFAEKWGVEVCFSTPYFAQSNGRAEAAVNAMKALILKAAPSGDLNDEVFQQGILECVTIE